MEKVKKAKVYTKFRSRKYDIIRIPQIKLEGKWLDKVGFKEGVDIIVQHEPNKLTIMIVK